MAETRISKLKAFLDANPQDCFVRYGLAQEHAKLGELDAAAEEFEKIIEINPDYQAAYYHLGRTQERLGLKKAARSTYEKGVETSLRTGDAHARSELEAALKDLR